MATLLTGGGAFGTATTNLFCPSCGRTCRCGSGVASWVVVARRVVTRTQELMADFEKALAEAEVARYRTFPAHALDSVCAARAPVVVRAAPRPRPRPWAQSIRAFRGPCRRTRRAPRRTG